MSHIDLVFIMLIIIAYDIVNLHLHFKTRIKYDRNQEDIDKKEKKSKNPFHRFTNLEE